MTILVTGCAGFIGSHVCRLLLEAGEAVEGVDNLNDAYDPRIKHWRLDQLLPEANFRFHGIDISDGNAVESLFGRTGVDGSSPFSAVINLGARAGVRDSVQDPRAFYQANALGTLNLLESCRETEVSKFVLASTSSLYGDDTPRPFEEDADTSRPLSPYAASKKAAECLAYTYHHLYGLDTTVLRYFTVYGPAGRPDLSIFRFIRSIAEGETITVFGDGKQERDFTYIDDIARGTVAATRPLGYEIINLGTDRPVVLADLIQLIEERAGKRAQIEYAPMHPTDVRFTRASIVRAKELLGWRPEVTIEEGIERSVEWYRENREWAKDIG